MTISLAAVFWFFLKLIGALAVLGILWLILNEVAGIFPASAPWIVKIGRIVLLVLAAVFIMALVASGGNITFS